jgi:CDP-diacylglycerol--serine O-phosphatidyltransferase
MIFVIILSLLMVSSIKYYSFKDLKLLARKPFTIFFSLIVLSIIVAVEPELMFFVLMLGYALSGPIWLVVKIIRKSKEKKNNIQIQ